MIDEATIETTLRRLADGFLNEVRPIPDGPQDQGAWGQFLNRPGDTQVGLYGTCSGTIVVSLAYGGGRVPAEVRAFLRDRWNSRENPQTNGPRDFSLTLRLAYFYLALRIANIDELGPIAGEVQAELRKRQVNELWRDWQMDAQSRSPTGGNYTTAFVILAHTLPGLCGIGIAVPDYVKSAAKELERRLLTSEPSDSVSTRLMLAAVATALSCKALAGETKTLLDRELRRTELHQHHLLRFFDYRFRSGASVASRRDYSVIPQAAMDVVLARSDSASFVGRLVGLQRSEWILSRISPGQASFFTGSNDALAGSKDQAWAAMALAASRQLLHSDRFVARISLSIQRNDAVWGYVSAVLLLVAGAVSLAPEMALSMFDLNASGEDPDPWAREAAFAIRLVGTVTLAAWGQSLGRRGLRVVRGWLR